MITWKEWGSSTYMGKSPTSESAIRIWEGESDRLVQPGHVLKDVILILIAIGRHSKSIRGSPPWNRNNNNNHQFAYNSEMVDPNWNQYFRRQTKHFVLLQSLESRQGGDVSYVDPPMLLLVDFLFHFFFFQKLGTQVFRWNATENFWNVLRTTINTFSAVSSEHLTWVQLRNLPLKDCSELYRQGIWTKEEPTIRGTSGRSFVRVRAFAG